MPSGEEIDLLILSHSDADHINSVVRLLELRKVKQVVRSGYRRDTKAWCSADYWIKVKVDGAQQYADSIYKQRLESCKDTGRPIWVNYDGNWPPPKSKDFNLRYYEVTPGQDTFVLGTGPNGAKITLLHGLNKSPSSWDSDFPTSSRESRRRNAISIVAQLEYRGKTVLRGIHLTGPIRACSSPGAGSLEGDPGSAGARAPRAAWATPPGAAWWR